LDLVAAEAANPEIAGAGMGEIEAGDGRTGPHREAFGKVDAGVGFRVEKVEDRAFLGMVGAGGVAGGRTDAAVLFADQLLVREHLVRGIAPEFAPDPGVETFGEGL